MGFEIENVVTIHRWFISIFSMVVVLSEFLAPQSVIRIIFACLPASALRTPNGHGAPYAGIRRPGPGLDIANVNQPPPKLPHADADQTFNMFLANHRELGIRNSE